MQIEILEEIPLHDEKGFITKEGWARKPYWQYDRSRIKACKIKIKEWDYYAAISHKNGFGIALTISDMGYLGFSSITFFDFNNKYYNPVDSLFLFPMGRLNLSPKSDEGLVKYEDKKIKITVETIKFSNNTVERRISFNSSLLEDFYKNKGIEGEITLITPDNDDTICIATSWKEKRTAFYYNQKINCMVVKGQIKIGNKIYSFDEQTDLAVLDWGRGVWTYKNRWYWSSLSSYLDGKRFGWNLGYGFSDRSLASENAIFYDGKLYKLDNVEFKYDPKNYLKNWKIFDNEGRLNVDFVPIIDRNSKSEFLIIKSIQHQVFGYFSGIIKLEENKTLKFNNLLGFAEDVFNAW
jgi:hypothetical protein